MNLKKAIEYFKNRKNKNVNLEELYPNCPEVVIDDKELTVTLGQWMGKLPDSIKTGGNGMFVISHLDASELLARKMISQSDLDLITKRFANILKMAGFGEGNTCVLDRFDDENLTFRCVFSETGEVADMRVRFGSWVDNGPELYIDFDGIKTVYDFWHANEEQPDRLDLQSVTKDIDGNGKNFHHYASQYTYYGDVYDDENRVYVQIDYPERLDKGKENPYIDMDKMEEAISSVTFPISIEDLCSKVSGALKVEPKAFNKISIKVRKMKGRKELNVTDQADFNQGNLVTLTVTKNGKTITIDQFDAWSYTTPTYKVNQTADNKWNCAYTNMPLTEFVTMSNPQELVESLTPEVEQVRVLAKRLLEQRKKTTE